MSVVRIAVAVTIRVMFAIMVVGLVGAMLDDVLNDRPGNRSQIVAVCWYLCSAGTDPLAAWTQPNPGPTIPVVGLLTWFAISGIVCEIDQLLAGRRHAEESTKDNS